MNKWLPPVEAAIYIRCSPQTLANWRWQGKGPRWHKAGGKILYDIADLDAFVLGDDRAAS